MATTIKEAVQDVKAELARISSAGTSKPLIDQALKDTQARLDQLATQFADAQPARA
jgi:hypothetical protein